MRATWEKPDYRYATWQHWICAIFGHAWSLSFHRKLQNCDRCHAFRWRRFA